MSAENAYFVEINDWTPDVLEYRPVADQDWAKIDFPPETYFFAFYERAKGQAHPPVSDWFYLTTDPRILTPEEAAREFPEYAETVALWSEKGVKSFAHHAYEHGEQVGGRIIPLLAGCALIDRKAKTQVWPTAP
ncbi:hypothetical protein G6L37_00080 [Agrobacterium rubi]|nr:hypothetical protein [Agrobacterium rubi]NTF23647.1 hypothetical protein [Agrobacterium rubi]